jgi:hypothetical protein
MSDTYSEAEKRIEQALDEMRALESAPVIADFARQYNVPYNRLYRRFHGTPSKSDRFSVNRRFLDVEEKAMCRYLIVWTNWAFLRSVNFFEGRRTIFLQNITMIMNSTTYQLSPFAQRINYIQRLQFPFLPPCTCNFSSGIYPLFTHFRVLFFQPL